MTRVTKLKAVASDNAGVENMEKDMAAVLVDLKGRAHSAKADIALLTERKKVLAAEISGERKELSRLNEELELLLAAIAEKESVIDEMADVHEVIMNAAVALDTLSKNAPKRSSGRK
ncbi:MAG TPA: hypothetical protein VKA67_08215 [Verrucomicrobiae bacterium]|nr:hypothetical protein [Verrucomicrobiae bacterium]